MSQNLHDPDLHAGGAMLAESENVSVFHCSCGNIHLQIGSVCLTMQPAELSEIGAVVLQALGPRRPHATVPATAVN